MQDFSSRNGRPREGSASQGRGRFQVLKTLLLWLLVFAGCAGLFGLVIEWVRSVIPISPP
jgi:hypothetical protein